MAQKLCWAHVHTCPNSHADIIEERGLHHGHPLGMISDSSLSLSISVSLQWKCTPYIKQTKKSLNVSPKVHVFKTRPQFSSWFCSLNGLMLFHLSNRFINLILRMALLWKWIWPLLLSYSPVLWPFCLSPWDYRAWAPSLVAGIIILDFPVSKTVRNKFPYKLPSLWYSVTEHRMTQDKSNSG